MQHLWNWDFPGHNFNGLVMLQDELRQNTKASFTMNKNCWTTVVQLERKDEEEPLSSRRAHTNFERVALDCFIQTASPLILMEFSILNKHQFDSYFMSRFFCIWYICCILTLFYICILSLFINRLSITDHMTEIDHIFSHAVKLQSTWREQYLYIKLNVMRHFSKHSANVGYKCHTHFLYFQIFDTYLPSI